MIARACLLAVACTLGAALPAAAQSDAATRAADLLQAAGAALREADGARDRVEALTTTVRAYEDGLSALRDGMRQTALQERIIVDGLTQERARLARLLGVLQTIEGAPAPLLLMHPEGPLGTARSGMLISDVTPAIAREALALRAQLTRLDALRTAQAEAAARLTTALDEVQTARIALSEAIADRVALPGRFIEDSAAMERLLASAETLDAFATRLAEAPQGAQAAPDFAQARGTLPLPVLGTLLRRAGETDAAGVTRPGLLLATGPAALVTAPWPASVRYAGPLLDYGNVIILEPDPAYLLVLAGLGALYATPGQLVTSGEALGLMPGAPVQAGDLIVPDRETPGAGLSETLYVEVRQNGRPLDPEDWFTD